MLKREELGVLLEKAGFEEQAINRILNKKIKDLLRRGKAEEIERIFKVLDNHDIGKETIENCLIVLARGKADEIEGIFKVLDDHKIEKETIENCLSVLARGKAEEIERIFKVLDDHCIRKGIIRNCLLVLAEGKADEIEKIFKVLDDHNIENEKIEKCLTVLAQGKAEEIVRIFKILDEHGIENETIEKCLTVLARGKAEEMERIFKVLDAHEIGKETMENCLYILARGKAEKIEKKFKILDDNNIEKEIIKENYGILFLKTQEELEKVFSEKSDSNILLYLKLKGYYNRIVTKEEINEICTYKELSNKKLFMKLGIGEHFEEILLQTLQKKDSIYIGKSISMNREQMEKYSETILTISKNVSKNIAYQYGEKDISELESLAISIIVEKCGDVAYNTEVNPEIMFRCIYSKCKKYLIGKILLKKRENFYSFNELMEKNSKYSEDKKQKTDDNIENNLNLEQWNLSEQQQDILHCLSNFLECGYNYGEALNHVATTIGIDQEELVYEMEEIKGRMKEDGILEKI